MINLDKNKSAVDQIKEYSKEDIQNFINQFYNWQEVFKALGYDYVNRTLKNYFKSLDIDISHFNSEIKKSKSLKNYTKEELQSLVNSVSNWKELCRKVNNKHYNSVKKQVIEKGVDVSHFNGNGTKKCEDDLFIKTVAESFSYQEVFDKLKVYNDINTIYLKIKHFNLSTEHFIKELSIKDIIYNMPLEELKDAISSSSNWKELSLELGVKTTSYKLIQEYLSGRGLEVSFSKKKKSKGKDKSNNIYKKGVGYYQLNKLKNVSKEELEEVVKDSINWHDLLRKVNSKFGTSFCRAGYRSLGKYIKNLNIDTSRFIKVQSIPDLGFSDEELISIFNRSYSWKEFYKNLGIENEILRIKGFYKEKILRLGVDLSHFVIKPVKIDFTEEEFNSAFQDANNWEEVIHNLGYEKVNNYLKDKIVKRADELGLDYSRLTANRLEWDEKEFVKKLNSFFKGKISFIGPFNRFYEDAIFSCKKHGIFQMTPYEFLQNKKGCPKCNESKGEAGTREFLEINDIVYDYQKRFDDCRYINPLPFDFYLPIYNIAIEYQGDHHLKPVKFPGMTDEEALDNFKAVQRRDKIKKEYCIKNNILLIEIFSLKEIPEKLGFLVENKKDENQPEEDLTTNYNCISSP